MCTFFHATNINIPIGGTFSIEMFNGETITDHVNRREEERKINDILDNHRPDGVMSRKKCIYLFSNLSQCMKYAFDRNYHYIYEVECDSDVYGPYPMTLVTTLYMNPDNLNIVNEYWNPTKNWKVCEFLTSSIQVVQKIPFNQERVFIDDYVKDRELSLRVFHN